MGARVVVVDDHRDVALALDFALSALGHEVYIAHDAMSGLRAVIEHNPELVLIDLVMPVVDGWALAQSIRDLHLAIEPRLVAMSGYATPDTHGFDHHLAKPIGLRDLANLVAGAN